MSADPSQEHFDLLGYLSVLWRRKWVFLGLTALTLAAALTVSYALPATYVSTARVLVKSTALNPAGSVPITSTFSMPTESEVAKSQTVIDATTEALRGSLTPTEVRQAISVSVEPESQILTITFQAGDAESALKGAETVAKTYLEDREAQAKAAIDKAVAYANTQITDLQRQVDEAAHEAASAAPGSDRQIEASNRAAQLNDEIAIWHRNTSSMNIQAIDAGQVLEPAALPSSPASPDHVQDAIRGLLLGLLIGVAAALFVDRAKRRHPAG